MDILGFVDELVPSVTDARSWFFYIENWFDFTEINKKNKTKQQANKLNCVAMIMINISSTKPHFIFLADSDTEKLDHMLEFIGRCTKRLSSFHILFPAFFFFSKLSSGTDANYLSC